MSVPIEFRAPEAAIAGATATMTVAGSDHQDYPDGYTDTVWYRYVATASATEPATGYYFAYWEITTRHTTVDSRGTYSYDTTVTVRGSDYTSSRFNYESGSERTSTYEEDGKRVTQTDTILSVVAVYYYKHKATMRILCDKDSREILAAERPSARIGRIYFDGSDYILNAGEPGPDDDDLGDETE